jgi:hypothetical protein
MLMIDCMKTRQTKMRKIQSGARARGRKKLNKTTSKCDLKPIEMRTLRASWIAVGLRWRRELHDTLLKVVKSQPGKSTHTHTHTHMHARVRGVSVRGSILFGESASMYAH